MQQANAIETPRKLEPTIDAGARTLKDLPSAIQRLLRDSDIEKIVNSSPELRAQILANQYPLHRLVQVIERELMRHILLGRDAKDSSRAAKRVGGSREPWTDEIIDEASSHDRGETRKAALVACANKNQSFALLRLQIATNDPVKQVRDLALTYLSSYPSTRSPVTKAGTRNNRASGRPSPLMQSAPLTISYEDARPQFFEFEETTPNTPTYRGKR